MEEKISRFKNWFFKGRIEKSIIKQERIEILSKEYDDGNFLKVEK